MNGWTRRARRIALARQWQRAGLNRRQARSIAFRPRTEEAKAGALLGLALMAAARSGEEAE